MPPHVRFARERWHGRWNDPWVEQAMARREAGRESSRRTRLWLPVFLSLVIQLPAVFVRFRPGVGVENIVHTTALPILMADLGLTLVGPVALIFARRFPGPVVAICAAAGAADLMLFNDGDRPPYVALAFAIVSAIVRGARSWAWISVAAAWVLTLAISLVVGIDLQPGRVAGITLGILIVMGIAEAVRSRRENYAEFSRRYAERKQSEVQAERVRIARELHDVLAHSLSQINVQAGVGLHLMDSQPDKARDALASIKDTSKTALDEVRSVLGVLRAEGGADPSAPLVPEPDLSRLAGLAASIEAQGIQVTIENDITSPPPAATQLALYRIAQESLTNVLRHAKATAVTVDAGRHDDDYVLTITDNGTGGGPSRSDGRGLLGMHERAELLGGSLEAGPVAGGGFRVSARIPAKGAE
ncbi:MAG: sensor histidine kinase [Actinomycetota bacterium]